MVGLRMAGFFVYGAKRDGFGLSAGACGITAPGKGRNGHSAGATTAIKRETFG